MQLVAVQPRLKLRGFLGEYGEFAPLVEMLSEPSNYAAQSLLLCRLVAKRDRMLVGRCPLVYTLIELVDKEFVMLVLSRKVGERIHVGNDIILEIRRIAGNRVTLALDAPRNVRILRGELERAAREFRQPQMTSPPPSTSATAMPGRMAILNNLPASPAGRDFAI
jgi:carbon storage regulator